MNTDKIEIEKELEEKYNQITRLVGEYNKLAFDNKLDSRVGSIINSDENNEDDEYEEGYSTSGWWPSSLGC